MENHKLFKINQNAVIRNENGEVLILEQNGKWMLPGGRLENEGWLEGLRREVKEETGIENFEVQEIANVDVSGSGETYIVTFLCRIKNMPSIILSDEHQQFSWLKLEDIEKFEFWHISIKNRLSSLVSSKKESRENLNK